MCSANNKRFCSISSYFRIVYGKLTFCNKSQYKKCWPHFDNSSKNITKIICHIDFCRTGSNAQSRPDHLIYYSLALLKCCKNEKKMPISKIERCKTETYCQFLDASQDFNLFCILYFNLTDGGILVITIMEVCETNSIHRIKQS